MILTLAVLVLLELITFKNRLHAIPPGYFYFIPVVLTVIEEGLAMALVAGTIGLLYSAYYYSSSYMNPQAGWQYTFNDAIRLIVLIVSTYAIIFLVGWLKQREEKMTKNYNEEVKHQLQRSELLYSGLAAATPDFMWSLTNEGIIDYANKAWTDYTQANILPGTKIHYEDFVLPEDLTEQQQRLIDSWNKQEAFTGEFRYKKHDGSYRWFTGKVVPVKLPNGQLLKWVGTATDIHDRKIHEALAGTSKQQLEIILGVIADGVTVIDINGKMIYANEAAARLCGFQTLEQFLQTPPEQIVERFQFFDEQGSPLSPTDLPTRKSLQGLLVPEITVRFVPPGQTERWVTVKATPVFDDRKRVTMSVNIFKDITHIKQAQAESLRQTDRQLFLSKAGELLSSSLNYEETLKGIAYLAVPKLADWTAVDMLADDGSLKRLAVAHQDPARIAKAYELTSKYPTDMSSSSGVAHVIITGEPEFHQRVADETIVAVAKDEQHLQLMRDIGFSSLIIAPLKILDKTVGAITFVNAESKTYFSKEDFELAQELARRASLAIQNSKLYAVAQQAAENEHQQAELLNTLLRNAPVGFAFLNTNLEYVLLNQTLADFAGLSVAEHLGRNIFELFPSYEPAMRPHFEKVLQTGEADMNSEASGETPTKPGRIRHWFTNYYPVKNQKGEIFGIGMIVQETTEQHEAEREIYFRAYHDVLTGLPNRKAFEERLLKALHLAKTGNFKFAIMFLDMDRLKAINDGLGHDVGDAVIKEIGGRLTAVLRAEDTVARWGGDEFVILLPEIFGVADTVHVAEKILAAISPVMQIRNHALHITASIGIAVFPGDGQDVQSLQKNADTALYRAKEAGRNRYELYTPSMNVKAAERIALEHDLRQALQHQQFFLDYQPIVDLKTKKIKWVEVLLRWKHPRFGILHPARFLSIAEDIGLIIPLGKWVLATAAKEIKKLQQKNIFLQATVNISARQFSDDQLVDHILEALKAARLESCYLEIEITESLAMENLDRTKSKLLELKDKGVAIIVDDFGTGYSSLNYLKKLPIDKLKIDKSFVRHMITDAHDTSIIKAIISMAQSLHLKVVAEGVDTEMQMNLLASLGCDAVQGYYISKPLNRRDLAEFVENWDKPPVVEIPNEETVQVDGKDNLFS